MSTAKTAFALDPTLPWLLTDPKMQEPAAFHGMETLTLPENAWEPMAQYFPANAQLAMRRVTSLDQLTEGAAYWSEQDYYEPSKEKVVTRYNLGRYAGPAYPESKSTASRWKRGAAHIELEADVLDCNLRSFYFREDGTYTAYVDVRSSSHRLYQITHYIGLPASLLAGLGTEAIKSAGINLRQACYLKQEKELKADAVELTAQVNQASGCTDWRVVLPFDEIRDFLTVQESLKQLTRTQANKRKEGALTVTFRNVAKGTGCEFSQVEYFALEEATILLDWMRHHSDVQEASLSAAVTRHSIGLHAEAIKAQWKAQEAAELANKAAAKASESMCCTLGRTDEYAGIRELALAA